MHRLTRNPQNKIILLLLAVIMLLAPSRSQAQIEENLQRYTGDNASGYIAPLVTSLGMNFNRGWYRSAKIGAIRPYIYVGMAVMEALIADQDKTYMARPEGGFMPDDPVEVATVVGSPDAVIIQGVSGTEYAFPGGLNLNAVPFAAPQVTIGGILGTEVTVRYASMKNEQQEFGTVTLKGYGLRHSISQYFPLLPFDISAGYFYQSFTLDDSLIAVTASHFGVQASKASGVLTLYGGIGFDKSNATVSYQPAIEGASPVNLDIDGNNGLVTTLGIALKFAILHINADFNMGAQNALSVGIGLGL